MKCEKMLFKIPAVKAMDSRCNEFLYILKGTNGCNKWKWNSPPFSIYHELLCCSSQVFRITRSDFTL